MTIRITSSLYVGRWRTYTIQQGHGHLAAEEPGVPAARAEPSPTAAVPAPWIGECVVAASPRALGLWAVGLAVAFVVAFGLGKATAGGTEASEPQRAADV